MTDQNAVFFDRRGKAATGTAPQGFGLKFSGPLGVLSCSVLFVAALTIAVAGRLANTEALSLPGAFGVVIFGVGAAPLQLLSRLDIYARLTGATLVGLSILLGVGALMADVRPLWQPVPAAIAVGTVTIFLHVRGLSRVLPGIELALRSASDEFGQQVRRASGLLRASLVLTLTGTLLWLVPALTTHDPEPGIWGFLTIISPVWYAGLVMVVFGFALGRRGELSALVSTLSFGLASTVTPAMVYATPRAGAAAKQMLLTQYVLTHHHIDPPAGIYQAFSALFSGMAWLCQLIDVHGMLGHDSLLGLATYWPVILVVPRVLMLRLFAGRLSESAGRGWAAVMLVMLVDTINDANYFSPQSVGYLMAFSALAFVVKGVEVRPLRRRATFGLVLLTGLALAPTHELSPYLAAGALLVLAVFGEAPWWCCLLVGVPALGWAAVVHGAISANFSFGQLFDISNLLPPGTPGVPGLVRLPAVGYQSHALLVALLVLIGLAAIGFLADFGTRWAWGYGVCPVVGVGLVLINPYGNEGIFRSSLFAIPWLAVLAMCMPPAERLLRVFKRPAVLITATSALLLGLLATFVVAEWGVDGTSVLLRSDIAVTEYLRSQPARNAFVTSLGAAGDTIVNYPPFLVNYKALAWDSIATRQLLDVKRPDAADLVALTDSYGIVAVRNYASNFSPLYIFWSSSTRLASDAYAVQSVSQMNRWLELLKTSPVWRVADRDGDSYLFELRR